MQISSLSLFFFSPTFSSTATPLNDVYMYIHSCASMYTAGAYSKVRRLSFLLYAAWCIEVSLLLRLPWRSPLHAVCVFCTLLFFRPLAFTGGRLLLLLFSRSHCLFLRGKKEGEKKRWRTLCKSLLRHPWTPLPHRKTRRTKVRHASRQRRRRSRRATPRRKRRNKLPCLRTPPRPQPGSAGRPALLPQPRSQR